MLDSAMDDDLRNSTKLLFTRKPPREHDEIVAGILAADVVGYSAKMGADDAKTLARVRTLRTEVIEPQAATHGGRLFKAMGDGFLVEFPSAVQALRSAIAIQDRLRGQPDGLRLRIGVHQDLGCFSRFREDRGSGFFDGSQIVGMRLIVLNLFHIADVNFQISSLFLVGSPIGLHDVEIRTRCAGGCNRPAGIGWWR